MNTIPVFLDTDIGPDCDDVAALTILLSLHRAGFVKLLGVTHCTGSPYGCAAVDSCCRLFDVDVPIGTCSDAAFLSSGPCLAFTPSIAKQFQHRFPPEQPQPDAAEAFIKALTPAEEHSVTVIGIGPMKNMARYFTDPLAASLMRTKVKRIVCMAGCFELSPVFAEWNVEMDIPSAKTVIDHWDGPLDFCPFEALYEVLTGACLSNYPETPASVAYRIFTKGTMLRPSWDLGTVLAAANQITEPFEWSKPGRISIDSKGITGFTEEPSGKHRYLRLNGEVLQAQKLIESFLDQATMEMTKSNRGNSI